MTTKKNTKVTSTEIAKIEDNANRLTNLFGNIDVAALNAAVEDIANRDTQLSGKEKILANEIIGQWETGVVEQLNNEQNKIQTFINSIKNFTTCYKTLIDNPEYFEPMQTIIDIAGLTDESVEIGKLIEAERYTEQELTSVKRCTEESDETSTEIEKLDAKYKKEKELTIKKHAHDKATRDLSRKLTEFTLTLNKNEDVQACLAKLTSYNRAITKNKTECRTKANTAKLAVSIDDKELRDKLKALINISVK